MTENLLGGVEPTERTRNSNWLWPLLPIAMATFALSALVAYQLHGDHREADSFLQHVVIGIYSFFGFVPSFFFFLLLLSWSSIWFLTGRVERPVQRVLRLLGLTLALSIWVNLQPEGAEPSPAAGQLGSWLGGRMLSLLGHFFSVVLVAPLTLGALLLATDFFFYRFFEGMHARLDQLGPQPGEGVETQVTEHLKGLSDVIAQPAPSSTDGSDVAATPGGRINVVIAGEEEEEPIVLRRLSSYERRQRAAAAQSMAAEEPEAEPAPVEAPSETIVADSALEVASEAVSDSDDGHAERAPSDADEVDDDLGHDLSVAAASAAEPVPPSRVARRGRLAPIVVTDEADATVEDGRAFEAKAELAQLSHAAPAHAATDFAADMPSPDLAAPESDVALDGHAENVVADDAIVVEELSGDADEAPADESPRAEPMAEAAPADEVPERSDVFAAGREEPELSSGTIADDGDEASYFADSADEPPEVEPVVEVTHLARASESHVQVESEMPAAADVEAVEEAVAETAAMASEPVIAIPRPPEGVRQQRLFVGVVDDSLVRDAIDVVTQSRRASATHLQRKLRVDYEQALELLQVLAHRGVIELAEGESQGRVR